jgi:hypothetical protein
VETFLRREDAERFVEQVHGEESELAVHLRIEQPELDGLGGVNQGYRPRRLNRLAFAEATKGSAR